MSSDSTSVPMKWTPYLQSIARVIFGFLALRHGMEQVFGYPEASGAARLSYEGILELIVFPAAFLIMLGLFTRPVALAGMEASILFCFLYLFLWAAGPGVWSLDSLWRRKGKQWRTDMKVRLTALATLAALVLLSATADAQWVNRPTPGIPRLPNGKPNLAAPATRLPDGHPDFSGIWNVGNSLYFHDLARGLKPPDAPQLTPWAAALQKGRRDRNHVDDPYGYCLPLGVPRENLRSPFKIVQTPSMTIFLHESFVGNTFRQVFTDGRPLPELSETEPAWLGYSVGRWEGDEFVVESIGFRDRGWLSANMAYPNSDALRVTERWRRVDFGHMELTVTIDDPKAFVKPWTNKIPLLLQADTELLDSYCDNQQTILSHWSAGRPPDEPPSPPLAGGK